MTSVADELRKDLDALINEGEALLRDLSVSAGYLTLDEYREQVTKLLTKRRVAKDPQSAAKARPSRKTVDDVLKQWVMDFRSHYESWYSKALGMVSQVLPDRAMDFRHLYKLDRRKEIDFESYTLADYQIGLAVTRRGEPVFDVNTTAFVKFQQQLNIVKAGRAALDSRLADIRGVLQADLLDSELDSARELLKNGFLRASGVVAGVALEAHLADVARSHSVAIRSKSPTIAHYNDALKAAGTLDVPRWRSIQGLADIRNVCAHSTGREPTSDEVRDLIDGVAKVTKSIS